MRILIAAMLAIIALSAAAVIGAERPTECSILNRPPGIPDQPEDMILASNCVAQLKAQRAIAIAELGKERTYNDEDRVARIVYRSRGGKISKDDLDYLVASLLSWKALAIRFGDDLKITAKDQDAMLGKALDIPVSMAPDRR